MWTRIDKQAGFRMSNEIHKKVCSSFLYYPRPQTPSYGGLDIFILSGW
jgi:hypothetical protein